MNIHKIPFFREALAFSVSCVILCGAFVLTAMADDDPKGLMDVKLAAKPEPLATEVETGIDYLFEVLRNPGTPLEPGKFQAVLDFVDTTEEPKDIEPAKRFDARGICLRSNVQSSLDRILKYFYNPEIPNYLLCPALLRLSGWHEGSEILTRGKGLWDDLATLDQPVLVRGREFESTTPDSFAEAYYLYDLNRLMILLKYQGRNVLLSITEQEDKSDVGRKGAILNDKEWDYFYSGLEGLNKGMIGWMDTFTYASGSVQVYIEGADQSQTTVHLFKWLRAGWAGMNVVKRKHIYDGTMRYMRSFSKVVESDSLTPEHLARGMKDVEKMSIIEKDVLIRQYAKNFEARFKDNPKLKDSDYAEILENGGYAAILDERARESVASLEKLKSMLGMPTLIPMPETKMAEVETPAVIESAGDIPAVAPVEEEMAQVEPAPES